MRWLCVLCLVLPARAAAAGEKPLPGETVSYRVGAPTAKAARFRPAGKGQFPAVVVVHGDFGPTAWVKKQAARLAARGYLTLAIDLYGGKLPKDVDEAHILE